MEQTVNVSKIHNQTEITINQGRKQFYSLERKFYFTWKFYFSLNDLK